MRIKRKDEDVKCEPISVCCVHINKCYQSESSFLQSNFFFNAFCYDGDDDKDDIHRPIDEEGNFHLCGVKSKERKEESKGDSIEYIKVFFFLLLLFKSVTYCL